MTYLQPGVRVGRYEVAELIRLESMGPLYQVHDAARAARLSLLLLPAVECDIDASARFDRAVRSLIRLRHPNLAAVVDSGEFEGTPYLVIEHFPDGTLAGLIADGKRLGEGPSLRLLRGVANGIDGAHREGAIHGDLRPEWIFTDAAGNAVVAGVGLARFFASPTGTTMASQYVPPERVMGVDIGAAADVYALTALVYELLAGRPPFDEEQPEALLYAQVHGEPRPASQANPDLPEEMDGVLLRGLAKDPRDRWPTCADLVDAVESALSAARPVPQDLADGPVIGAGARSPRLSEAPRAGPNRLVIACGLFALALALLVAIVILERSPLTSWPELGRPA